MPEKETMDRAREDAREGKAPSTQAGEFVKEEMDHIREGKHGAANTKQAIAIGLSKARRAGVKLPPPKKGTTSAATRKKAANDSSKGRSPAKKKTSAKRSRATEGALKRMGIRQLRAVPFRSRPRSRLGSAAVPLARPRPRRPSEPKAPRDEAKLQRRQREPGPVAHGDLRSKPHSSGASRWVGPVVTLRGWSTETCLH